MKLSNLILEEYQERLSNTNFVKEDLESDRVEVSELEKTKLEGELFKQWDELTDRVLHKEELLKTHKDALFERLPTLIQAHKDALYMEEQIEKAKPQKGVDPEAMFPLVESLDDKCPMCNKNKLEIMWSYGGMEAPNEKLNDYHYLRCKKCEGVSLMKK